MVWYTAWYNYWPIIGKDNNDIFVLFSISVICTVYFKRPAVHSILVCQVNSLKIM